MMDFFYVEKCKNTYTKLQLKSYKNMFLPYWWLVDLVRIFFKIFVDDVVLNRSTVPHSHWTVASVACQSQTCTLLTNISDTVPRVCTRWRDTQCVVNFPRMELPWPRGAPAAQLTSTTTTTLGCFTPSTPTASHVCVSRSILSFRLLQPPVTGQVRLRSGTEGTTVIFKHQALKNQRLL